MQQVDENLTYDYLHSSEENLWSILYLTGYLTSVRADELENPLPERFTALTIPNEEIREIYETTVIRWFDESAPKWNRSVLFDAVWKGNIQELQGELNRLLRRTISYHDYKEDFYHAFLAQIFSDCRKLLSLLQKAMDSSKYHRCVQKIMETVLFPKRESLRLSCY